MLLKRFPLITLALALISLQGMGQLYINGATFYIEPGGTVTVQGDVTNSGTLTNDGTLQVQGSFTNSSVYNGLTTAGVLQMTGTGNVTLNGGASTINNLLINKTNATDRVLLSGTTLLGYTLNHTNGVFSTDPITNPSYLFSAPVAATFTFSPGKEIVGKVQRTGTMADATAYVFNQPNMLVTLNGGSKPSEVTVLMIPQTEGGDPTQAEREVKRRFIFTKTAGTGFTADVRYPYLTSELNTNTEPPLLPWQLVTTEWNAQTTSITRDAANDWVATAGLTEAQFNNQEWKLADPKYSFNVAAQLRGPWNGTTMNTSINSIIPAAQPYNTTPFNYAGTENQAVPNANVVDWVLVEHRKPADGLASSATSATITGRKAGYLLNTGVIVDLDGVTPLSFDIAKQGTSFVVVRHLNHLGVISNALASNAAGTFTNDFSVLANSYKPAGAPSDPVTLLSGGVKYGLWAGDANKSGVVNIADVNTIKFAIANSATGYALTDINMSNNINIADVNVTKTTIAQSGTGGAAGFRLTGKVSTNIPDRLSE